MTLLLYLFLDAFIAIFLIYLIPFKKDKNYILGRKGIGQFLGYFRGALLNLKWQLSIYSGPFTIYSLRSKRLCAILVGKNRSTQ